MQRYSSSDRIISWKKDERKLTTEAQEQLRKQATRLMKQGNKNVEIAYCFIAGLIISINSIWLLVSGHANIAHVSGTPHHQLAEISA